MLRLHGALRLRADRRRGCDEAGQHTALVTLGDRGVRPLILDTIFVPTEAELKAVHAGIRRARTAERINVVSTGIGPQRAAEAVARALRESRIERALVAGVCGLLAAAFLPGDLLLYADVRDAQRSDSLVKTDRALTAVLKARLPQAKTGIRALAWPSIVTTSQEKSKLGIRYGVDAIDMESHAILTSLEKAGVQTAVLRVASDGVNDDLPDLNAALDQNGALDNAKLIREMLRVPHVGMAMAWNGATALMRLRQAIARIAAQRP